jgi:hypothetical protein
MGVMSLALMLCSTSMTVCSAASRAASLPAPSYTGASRQPRSAPSASPPRSSCRTWLVRPRTSASLTSACSGCSVDVSKLTDESSSSASMSMVRQASLSVACVCSRMMDMVGGSVGVGFGGWGAVCADASSGCRD